jgi:hypothetical protein
MEKDFILVCLEGDLAVFVTKDLSTCLKVKLQTESEKAGLKEMVEYTIKITENENTTTA